MFATVLCIDVPRSSDGDLQSICKAAPKLEEITMHSPRCSNIGLAAIGKYCAGLKQLKLTAAVTNLDDALVAQGCKQLERLTLEEWGNMSDIGLSAISTHCVLLEELSVIENDIITDDPLLLLANHTAPRLLSLTLASCHSITGPDVVAIARRCPLLHTLNLNGTYEIVCYDIQRSIPH